MTEMYDSPPNHAASAGDALSWYKTQYDMLESELLEFRESSRELERELEKDIEQAEKRERCLQEKLETIGFEVEEWKRKYKESKTEASAAQTSLEKEVTQLRDANRSLQLRLRDVEVVNDDFERQARNTSSTLEDMESKYNQAIERGVLMEEEIRTGEQEREALRIDSQRLREELADLKIEAELMQDKIKKHEQRHLRSSSTHVSISRTSAFDDTHEASLDSRSSSPLVTTPIGTKPSSSKGLLQETSDPPSPPMSDYPAPKQDAKATSKAPISSSETMRQYLRSSVSVIATGSKPQSRDSSPRLISRDAITNPSLTGKHSHTPARQHSRKFPAKPNIPASTSLSHIRLLTAQMQRLEARVQSARSKLPAPSGASPLGSTRPAAIELEVPASITIRSRKRTTAGSTSSVVTDEGKSYNSLKCASGSTNSHVSRLSTSGISRLSFGSLPRRGPDSECSRPSSRTSISSYKRPSSRADMNPPPGPTSRASLCGGRVPLGRSQSSMSGQIHRQSAMHEAIDRHDRGSVLHGAGQRGTFSKSEINVGNSGIPALNGSSISMRRQSGTQRASMGTSNSNGIISRRTSVCGNQITRDLGETY